MKIMFLIPQGMQNSHAQFRVLPLIAHEFGDAADMFYKEIPKNPIRRYSFFSRLPHADVIVIHRELVSAFELGGIRRLCEVLVFDCSEAVWAMPGEGLNRLGAARKLAKRQRRFERLCQQADIGVADNSRLAKEMSGLCERVHTVPTAIDSNLYCPGTGGKRGGVTLVGWVETVGDLSAFKSTLAQLEMHAGQIQFSIVSRKQYIGPGREYSFWAAWSQENEPMKLQAMDIGLLPVVNDDFGEGGCTLNILKYMASGVAVVASDIGVHSEMVEHGVNGFLVRETGDWEKYVMMLANDKVLRARLAEAGRQKAVEMFSLREYRERYRTVLAF